MTKRRPKSTPINDRLRNAARNAQVRELIGPTPERARTVRRVTQAEIVEQSVVDAFDLGGMQKRRYRVKLLGLQDDTQSYSDTILISASSDADAKRQAVAALLAAPLAMGVRVRACS